MQSRALLFASLVLVGSGCVGPAADSGAPVEISSQAETAPEGEINASEAPGSVAPTDALDPGSIPNTRARVVVAVIDTGVAAYHETFSRPDAVDLAALGVPAVDQTTGVAALTVALPADLAAADRGSTLASRTLYHFLGTSVLFYVMDETVVGLDPDGHGTGTAGLVMQNAPEAVVLMIQATDKPAALEWAAAQPWIDIVTMSFGAAGDNAPFAGLGVACSSNWGRADLLAASRAIWANGKLIIMSAGNEPTLHILDPYDGPPWIISVGGVEPSMRGEAGIASKTADVVANFTAQIAQTGSSDAYSRAAGTSFAAPVVAGVLAGALDEIRTRVGHSSTEVAHALVESPGARVTNADLRAALNTTATYWALEDYDPSAFGGASPDGLYQALSAPIPINPLAPWVQMGWGYVNGNTSAAIVAAILDGPAPPKPSGAQDHMASLQAARELFWATNAGAPC